MRKSMTLLLATTAALGLGAASAQATTTTTTVTAPPVTFTDVPAGHWAREAVAFVTARGLIQGFPDGTFRGNENLTRYQAALIFQRLLQSGALGTMAQDGQLSPAELTVIVRGMQEVSADLAVLNARVADLEADGAGMTARLAALEAALAAAPQAGTAATGTAQLSATVIARLDALEGFTARLEDLENMSAGMEARLAAIEEQLAGMGTGEGSAALQARIDALELAVRNIPAGPAGPQGPAGAAANVTALEARIAALEARINQLGTAPAAPVTTAPATPAQPPVTATPAPGTTIVIGEPVRTAPRTAPNFYIGAYGNYPLTDANPAIGYGATLGLRQLIGPFGLRAGADFGGANFNNLRGELLATYHFGTGGLEPYAGVGVGFVNSASRTNANASAMDYSVQGVLGADFRFANNFGVFAEVAPSYGLTNSGVAARSDFGVGARAGLKVFF